MNGVTDQRAQIQSQIDNIRQNINQRRQQLNTVINSGVSQGEINRARSRFRSFSDEQGARADALENIKARATGRFTTQSLIERAESRAEPRQPSRIPFAGLGRRGGITRRTSLAGLRIDPGISTRIPSTGLETRRIPFAGLGADLRRRDTPTTDFNFLIRDERGQIIDVDIGGAIRRGSERFVGSIEKVIERIVSRIPEGRRTVAVPETRFPARGTAPFRGGRFVTPKPRTTKTKVVDFSLIKGLTRIKSPIGAGEVGLGLFFLPAFGFGTAGESRFIQDQITGKFILKSEVKKLAKQRQGQFKTLLSETRGIDTLSIQGKIIDLKQITRDLINRNKNNPQNIKNLRKLYKQSGREDLFKDIFAQEVTLLKPTPIKTAQPAQLPPAIAPSTTPAVRDLPAIVGGGGERPGAFTGTGRFERTTDVSLRRLNSELGLPQEFGRGSKLIESTLAKVKLGQATLSLEAQRLKSRQLVIPRLGVRERLGQSLDQPLRPRLRTDVATVPFLATRTRLRLRQEQFFRAPRFRFRPRFRIRPRFAIPPLLSGARPRRVVTLVTGRTPQKFDFFVRKKGKFILGNKKPFQTRSGATDALARRLDNTLRASGFVKRSTRAGSKKVSKSTKGFLIRNQIKFRPGKNDPKLLVEKRQFRIEKRSPELQDIKAARRAAKFKLKSTKMIKIKRRK